MTVHFAVNISSVLWAVNMQAFEVKGYYPPYSFVIDRYHYNQPLILRPILAV